MDLVLISCLLSWPLCLNSPIRGSPMFCLSLTLLTSARGLLPWNLVTVLRLALLWLRLLLLRRYLWWMTTTQPAPCLVARRPTFQSSLVTCCIRPRWNWLVEHSRGLSETSSTGFWLLREIPCVMHLARWLTLQAVLLLRGRWKCRSGNIDSKQRKSAGQENTGAEILARYYWGHTYITTLMFPLLPFPPLQDRADISTLVFSTFTFSNPAFFHSSICRPTIVRASLEYLAV